MNVPGRALPSRFERSAPSRWLSLVLLAFYLLDELLSSSTPFSSGPFALALVLTRVIAGARWVGPLPIMALATAALVLGSVGAWLSQTPFSALFVATTGLLAVVWWCGRSVRIEELPQFSAAEALLGTTVSVAGLLLSKLGLDVFSELVGASSNRGAGLFAEPSHLALYTMPLWLIAFQERRYRIWLYFALLIIFLASFTATLVVFLAIAASLSFYSESARSKGLKQWKKRLPLGTVVFSILLLSTWTEIGEATGQSYLSERLRGLFASGDAATQNLSSLVVLQGAELARISFTTTFGLGVGLGNFGISTSILQESDYRDLIGAFLNSDADLNVRDGGTLASKLVGETGVFALAVVWALGRALRRLRSVPSKPSKVYCKAMLATLMCLLFVRAMPYFAGPTCLALMALAALTQTHRATRVSGRRVEASGQPFRTS